MTMFFFRLDIVTSVGQSSKRIMSTLKLLKSVPNKSKHAVFGYIREMEQQLALSNIPVMINYLCLGYYFHGEYFEKAGDDLQILNDKMSVKRISEPIERIKYMNTAYGKRWIQLNSGEIFKWKFRIDSFGRWYGKWETKLFIGIVSRDDRINDDFGVDKPSHYFSIRENLDISPKFDYMNSQSRSTCLMRLRQYEFVCDSKNREIFICDTKTKEVMSRKLSIQHFPNDDTKYKLAICMIVGDATLTLTDFIVQ